MRIRIPDPGSGIFLALDPRWEKFESGIRVKHPGSAKLVKGRFKQEKLCFHLYATKRDILLKRQFGARRSVFYSQRNGKELSEHYAGTV
jgi:hypothetical protein